jgi:hypothetical protein
VVAVVAVVTIHKVVAVVVVLADYLQEQQV